MTNDRICFLTYCFSYMMLHELRLMFLMMRELRLALYNSFKILWQLKIFSIRLLRV